MNPTLAITYASHLVVVPPGAAEIGFDLACRDGMTVTVPSGRLEITGVLPVRQPQRGYYPSRRLRGTLQPAGWLQTSIPVELELLPWSSRWSELGLMPILRQWPPLVSPRRYFRAAHQVLDQLVRAIEEPFRPRLDLAAVAGGPGSGASLQERLAPFPGSPKLPSEAL
ncbi:MAG TPA: hypothetical protein VGL92_13035 [Acidimicrobiia bacterium]